MQNSDATNHANIVTLGDYGTNASVQALTGMHYPRAYANSVVLPDGKVLMMGGQVRLASLAQCNASIPMVPCSGAGWQGCDHGRADGRDLSNIPPMPVLCCWAF